MVAFSHKTQIYTHFSLNQSNSDSAPKLSKYPYIADKA